MPSKSNPSKEDLPVCQGCGVAVSPAAKFCPQCGESLDDIDTSLPTYCQTCGNQFDPTDEFCTQCGRPRDGGATTAEQPVGEATGQPVAEPNTEKSSYETFRQQVSSYLDAGWEIKTDHGDHVTVVDRNIGSIPVHIVLLIFTGGIGNLFYGWYHYAEHAETHHLSIDDRPLTPPKPTGSASGTLTQPAGEETTLTVVSGYLLSILLALLGLAFLVGGGTLSMGLIGLLFVVTGLYISPPVERRRKRRHSIVDFGRLRTVDHRLIPLYERCEESCVVCGTAIDRGLVRRRRDETVVAGLPIVTHDIQFNHYCVDCAHADLLDAGTLAGPDTTSDSTTARHPSASAGDETDAESTPTTEPTGRLDTASTPNE